MVDSLWIYSCSIGVWDWRWWLFPQEVLFCFFWDAHVFVGGSRRTWLRVGASFFEGGGS